MTETYTRVSAGSDSRKILVTFKVEMIGFPGGLKVKYEKSQE